MHVVAILDFTLFDPPRQRRLTVNPRSNMDNPQSTFNPETDFAAMDETIAATLTESNEPIAAFFSYAHLPPNLRAVSRKFAEVAAFIVTLPRSAERTVALRKVLEGKDAAVRASLPSR